MDLVIFIFSWLLCYWRIEIFFNIHFWMCWSQEKNEGFKDQRLLNQEVLITEIYWFWSNSYKIERNIYLSLFFFSVHLLVLTLSLSLPLMLYGLIQGLGKANKPIKSYQDFFVRKDDEYLQVWYSSIHCDIFLSTKYWSTSFWRQTRFNILTSHLSDVMRVTSMRVVIEQRRDGAEDFRFKFNLLFFISSQEVLSLEERKKHLKMYLDLWVKLSFYSVECSLSHFSWLFF